MGGLVRIVVVTAAIVGAILGIQFTTSVALIQKDTLGIGGVGHSDSAQKRITDVTMGKSEYVSTKFEVVGRVQGVFFRKHTKAKAAELGLTGWCSNTPRGTVEGEFEYESKEGQLQSLSSVPNEADGERKHWGDALFRHWLCNVGSPHSRIDGCTFSEKAVINDRKFDEFRVVR